MNWQAVARFARSSTGRLAASYLLVIMSMSFGYSIVLYNTSARELQRQVPPDHVLQEYRINGGPGEQGRVMVTPQPISDFFQERIDEGRHALLSHLFLLNMLTLVAGAGLSYYLARRSLQPIEQNMEAQSQFVSDASHELRTPLTTLRTSNEVALRNTKLTLGQSKQLLEQNVDEVGKLQALTDGLLTLARPDEGRVPTAPVSLQAVANDAMNRIVQQAQARNIAIDDQVKSVAVEANRQALTQALVILLDNAIKYGPADSTIHLESGKRAKQAYIAVRDEGPGIRPYDLRRIFDRFYRADQSRSTQHVPGHGIGLSLAKKLIEQQGGVIRAASTVGKGSTFTVSLPLASLGADKNDRL